MGNRSRAVARRYVQRGHHPRACSGPGDSGDPAASNRARGYLGRQTLFDIEAAPCRWPAGGGRQVFTVPRAVLP